MAFGTEGSWIDLWRTLDVGLLLLLLTLGFLVGLGSGGVGRWTGCVRRLRWWWRSSGREWCTVLSEERMVLNTGDKVPEGIWWGIHME